MARRVLSGAQLAVVQAVRQDLLDAAGQRPHPAVDDGDGDATVRLGVSGGADSMAMAAAVAHVRSRTPHVLAPIEALVVDHALFPGSAAHTAAVVGALERLGLPAHSRRVEVRDGGGPEDAARRARHDALWRTPPLAGGTLGEVWLAHTRDDQAEQVLLGLARGSGTRSLAGMARRRSQDAEGGATPDTDLPGRGGAGAASVVRPLLQVARATTVAACRDWGIEPWDDPANSDPRFRRSALRAVLPGLAEALGVDLAANLCRTADLARDDADLLDSLAERAASEVVTRDGVDARALAREHPALRSRVVHQWLRSLGSPASRAHVDAVLALALAWHGQGPVDAGNGVRVNRRDGQLVPVPRPVTAIT